MKRIALLIIALCCVLPTIVQAQQKQQHAIVKTRGRQLDDGSIATGRRISEAVVDVKGTGKILSDDKGELSFGVSVTSGYYLNNVTKDGYTLSDLDVISKQHQYQAQPVDILLESVEELNAYRRSIERKVRRNYQNQLDELSGRIDSLESADSAQAEEMARLRAELDRAYDEAEQYVDKMTEYYLNIDFDRETDFDIEISYYIINGMLDKADSLLATRGNIEERVRQNRMAQRAVERDKEMVAKDCYRKYEIASQRLERDSAAYYLKLRAELDPTNVYWQIDAASYLRDIIADYDQALSIYESALSYSLEHYGEYHDLTATLYNNIGFIYDSKGDYDTALGYLLKALLIREKVLGSEHPDVAISYDNIGLVYEHKEDHDKALEYYQKALLIKEKVLGLEHPDVAMSYDHIGVVYCNKRDYDIALDYYKKALLIREKVLGLEHPSVATSYNNIGLVYEYKGDYDTALDYYQKALSINEKVLGSEHPSVARSYNNIGNVYRKKRDYDTVLDYYQKALSIQEKVLCLEHPYVARSYNNIGYVYYYKRDYDTALDYYKKALIIYKKVIGPEYPDVATLYDNIGFVYRQQGNYDIALDYFKKALLIYEKVLGFEHPDVAMSYCNIGDVYYCKGNYDMALKYYKKALSILEVVYGANHSYVIYVRDSIEECKSML